MGTTFEELLSKLHPTEGASLSDTNENGETEQVIVINDKRQFIIPENYNTVLAYEGDVNSQIVTFQLPLYHEGHDLSKCSLKVIRWKSLSTNIEDWSVLEEVEGINNKESTQTLKWTIPPAAFVQAGNIEIAISLYDFDENKKIAFSWNSASYSGFKVEKTLSNIDHQGAHNEYNIPSKNEILRIYEEGHNIVAPQNYNFKIGNYGNKNTSFVYFQAPTNVGGINLLDDSTEIFVICSIGGGISTTKIDKTDNVFSSFADGSPGEGLVNFVWNVPNCITCNTRNGLKYVGPFSITVSFVNGDKKWVTSDFNRLVLGKALLDEAQEVLNNEYFNILDGTSSTQNLEERAVAGLVQLRGSSNIGDASPIKKNELVIQANTDGECTDILIGNDTDEPTILSELIQDRLYIPDRKDLGNANVLDIELGAEYRELYPDESISYQEFLSTNGEAIERLQESDLNFNTNIVLQNAGKYFGVMVPDLAPHLSAPNIITNVYFILETLEQESDSVIQIFRGITNTKDGPTNNQLIEFQRSGQKDKTGTSWSPWVETIDRGKSVATYVSTLYLGNSEELDLSQQFRDGGALTDDDKKMLNNSLLNFNNNSALKKSGRYTGVIMARLASALGAPPISQSTYFILETIRYSPEKGPDHWIVQIFTGINPPGLGKKSGKIIEFKRTLYTTNGESIWTDWVETIDRGSPIAKRFSLKHIGAPHQELDKLLTETETTYQDLIDNNNKYALEIIDRCNLNNFREAGRYCGLLSSAVASYINAPLVTQAQYFILETKVYGDDNTEKKSIDWIIQTFSGISNPASNEFTGEPFIYVRSMFTTTIEDKKVNKWTDWRRVLVKPFEEVVSITNHFTFSYYNNFCQRQKFSGTLSVICNAERKLKIKNSNNTHTIPLGSQGTLTIGNNKVSFLLVDPESKIHSGIATLTADKKIPNVIQGDVTWEIWDAVTCR